MGAERHGLAQLLGVDVAEPYIAAANEFAASRGVAAEFRLARAEVLPFEDASVDAVLSFDVMGMCRTCHALWPSAKGS